MEYVWKSSLWIVTRVFQRATNDQEYYWPTIYKAREAAVSTITNYWDYWSSDHPFQVYYKVRQLLLQSATAYNYFITKCDKCYYKVRELLKSATILSQSAIGITKCDDYYKGRQNKAVALCNKLEMDGRRTSKPKDKYHHRHCNNNNNNNNDNNNNNNNCYYYG